MCMGVRPCPLASFTCPETPRHAPPPALAAPVAAALSRARPGTGPRVRRRPPEEGPSDSDAGDSEDGDSDDSSHGSLTARRWAIAGARHSAPRKRPPRAGEAESGPPVPPSTRTAAQRLQGRHGRTWVGSTARSSCAISASPRMAAKWSGRLPSSLTARASRPASSSSRAASSCRGMNVYISDGSVSGKEDAALGQ